MKVLCLNDDLVTLKHTTHIIEKSGIADEVLIASSPGEALFYYSEDEVDMSGEYPKLIFLDMSISGQSIWDFLDHFTKTYLPLFPETKVIITSYNQLDQRDAEKARQYRCVVDFIPCY